MTFFIEFDDVDEFSATAVGEPGSRVFFLNARSGGERVSVRCEKQQVKAIASVPAPSPQRPAAARESTDDLG